MRISFDLDDTLILKTVDGGYDESLPPLKRSYVEERLRKGTRDLMTILAERGCEIWIYSNSYRGKSDLMEWFKQCGLPIANVVNQQIHDMKCTEASLQSSRPGKFPNWFGIDVHVDDSADLEEIASAEGFKLVRVSPSDANWVSTILAAIDT